MISGGQEGILGTVAYGGVGGDWRSGEGLQHEVGWLGLGARQFGLSERLALELGGPYGVVGLFSLWSGRAWYLGPWRGPVIHLEVQVARSEAIWRVQRMLLCGTRWYMLQSHDLFNFRKGASCALGGVGVERGWWDMLWVRGVCGEQVGAHS